MIIADANTDNWYKLDSNISLENTIKRFSGNKKEIWTLDTNCFLISTKQKQLCQFKQSVLYIFRNLAKRNKRAYFSVKLYKATKQFPVFLSPTAALCDVSSVFGEKAETEPQNM